MLIEIQDKNTLVIHNNVGEVVDATLRGSQVRPEIRKRDAEGNVEVTSSADQEAGSAYGDEWEGALPVPTDLPLENARIYPYAISRNRLERAIENLGVNARIVRNWEEADLVLTLKAQERRQPRRLREKSTQHIPVLVLRSNTTSQIEDALRHLYAIPVVDAEQEAVREAEEAIEVVLKKRVPRMELRPQSASIRRQQHMLVAQHAGLRSKSRGNEPQRYVLIYRDSA